ncbi:MAG: stage V sporulation protein T [Ruminococcus sp.]|nr:stage V sporulation protein T [Ruminococcus sp.]
MKETADANFKSGTEKNESLTPFAQISRKKGDVLSVSVISEGDPLEIYTNSDGEVIFKKYSAISEMSENAQSVAEIMHRIAGCPAAVFDKDHAAAVSGIPKKELLDRRVSGQLEELMESRGQYFCPGGSTNSFYPAEGSERTAIAAVPIITAGDVSGAVVFFTSEKHTEANDMQKSLINAAAQFLSRQIE